MPLPLLKLSPEHAARLGLADGAPVVLTVAGQTIAVYVDVVPPLPQEEPRGDWRAAWAAFAPLLPTAGLASLATALRTYDQRLLQGDTVWPRPLRVLGHYRVEGADPLAWCGWQGHDIQTVAELEDWFAGICYRADRESGTQPPPSCTLIPWIDGVSRDTLRAELLPEVEAELQRRAAP